MHISHAINKFKVGIRRKPVVIRCIILSICLLILFSLGGFANYHQTINAGGLPASDLEVILPTNNKPPQPSEAITPSNDKLANTPSIWPTMGTVTSVFGLRNSPLGDGSEFHQGIDIANNLGTPIVATADGTVIKSEWAGGYGNIVQIDHGNGIETIYGHNSQLAVGIGQTIKKGQVVSYLGNTGKSTGPHVHYEVRVNGTAVDPIKFLVQY